MKATLKAIILVLLVGGLVLIRLYEYTFFYDPFMHFFENLFEAKKEFYFPAWMFLNVFFRFLLNTIISLTILYVIFRNMGIIKFSALLYAAFFLFLFPLFIFLMHRVTPDDYLAAFYVRRFLVHPVLILLLLPAFFYSRLQRQSGDEHVRDI